MASQAVRLPSPARALFQGSRTTRPILKRPNPLPLSPAAPTASFSSLLSPSSRRAIKSPAPHVRFPSSPGLVATISTYSSDAYDRVPISISPNPVTLPGWAPKVFRSLSLVPQPSPTMAEFEDPRSPRLQPAADVTGAKAANVIRFAKMAATQSTPPARIQALEKALAAYPRSPYPSAMTHGGDAIKGKQLPHTANEFLETARARPWVQSREARMAYNRNKLGLTLGRPIGSDFSSSSSPLSQPVAGTAQLHTSSINRSKKPAPLALESGSTESDKLSNAFWNSVSIESANEPMVTALEYPESAVEYEEKMDIGLRSASQPPLMFANADGVLFSPGLPKPHFRVEKLRESIQQMMSPSVKRSSFSPIARKEVTAPSPNDPFAAFPSFGAVLEKVGMESPIQYPAPIAQMA
jgi:hypothetical protein